MKQAGIKVLDIILWMWSHFPALCLSDDNNFGTLKFRNIQNNKAALRFSIISPVFGDRVLYIFSIKQKTKWWWEFRRADILSLSDQESIKLTAEQLNAIQNRYREHLEALPDSTGDIEIEREKLQYHIEQEQHRIDSSLEKINAYSAIVLTVIPITLALFDVNKVGQSSCIHCFLLALSLYAFMNVCFLIFRTLEVQGISKSSFSDLRISSDKKREINIQYQYDWQTLKYKAAHFVSLLDNLQSWMIALLVIVLLVYLT